MDDERRWKVGELAAATGLTVRTLHHFDEIGLLPPSERSAGGHRLYTAGDVRRLYRVLAFRQLGMSLHEIAVTLDRDGGDLPATVHAQLRQVEEQITLQQQLKRRLTKLAAVLEEAREPSVDEIIESMEAMMQAKYFTPEQLTRMKARHGEVGGDAFGRWHRRWTEICAEVKAHIDAGANPADEAVQQTARAWVELMEDMTGGDRAILAGMYAKLDGKGPEAATLGVVSGEVWEYMKRVFAVGSMPAGA
jgi:DNA-binding transcriptional MerR regulator